jgi:hypothetical protein
MSKRVNIQIIKDTDTTEKPNNKLPERVLLLPLGPNPERVLRLRPNPSCERVPSLLFGPADNDDDVYFKKLQQECHKI